MHYCNISGLVYSDPQKLWRLLDELSDEEEDLSDVLFGEDGEETSDSENEFSGSKKDN